MRPEWQLGVRISHLTDAAHFVLPLAHEYMRDMRTTYLKLANWHYKVTGPTDEAEEMRLVFNRFKPCCFVCCSDVNMEGFCKVPLSLSCPGNGIDSFTTYSDSEFIALEDNIDIIECARNAHQRLLHAKFEDTKMYHAAIGLCYGYAFENIELWVKSLRPSPCNRGTISSLDFYDGNGKWKVVTDD